MSRSRMLATLSLGGLLLFAAAAAQSLDHHLRIDEELVPELPGRYQWRRAPEATAEFPGLLAERYLGI